MAFTTINKSTDYFNTKLYTGNNTSQSITGLNFKPDWCWIKSRSNTEKHVLQDVLIGTGYELTSQDNSAKNPTSGASITSFNSDGISVGSGNAVNDNSINYVNWNWKANGAGSSNTDGSINTTYTSANTTSGFSISTYTGTGANATIGHGLGVAPQVVIYKRTNTTGNWFMYNKNIGNTKYLNLDATSAVQTYNVFQNTDPSSTLLYVSGDSGANASSGTYVAYCFAEKQGYSKMGSYIGNGNADGTFVYTGFKPAFVLIKDSGRAESWYIFDNRRLGYNGGMADLIANSTATESGSSATLLDFLSNGFKLTGTTDHLNGSGQNFIYMAFAETPFVANSGESIPTTAR